MKILLYGVGALGSLLAHFLCKAGNDVTVVARSTYDELKKNGIVVVHHYMHKTTVDHPNVVREAPLDERYDIVFSVMQAQQQLNLLEPLSRVNTDLVVLVGNNLEADRCESYIKEHGVSKRDVVFAFQNSMGHREGGKAVTGGLPVTELFIGGLHGPADPESVLRIKEALDVKGYKVTVIDNMYSYYLSHVAEIVPYCAMCYKVDYDLKKLSRNDIKQIVRASGECFDYLKSSGITPMPPKEDEFYSGGIKGYGMFVLYRIMSKTHLGELCISDHCKNGIDEMRYIKRKFQEYIDLHPGKAMPTWDSIWKYVKEA